MGRVVVLVLLDMVVVVMLSVRSQSRSRCGGEPERRTQGLTGCVGAATQSYWVVPRLVWTRLFTSVERL